MTNTADLNPDHYAVVYFGPDDVPSICRGSAGCRANGVYVDGKFYAIFPTRTVAVEELRTWPDNSRYGIMPLRPLVKEVRQPRFVLTDSAKGH